MSFVDSSGEIVKLFCLQDCFWVIRISYGCSGFFIDLRVTRFSGYPFFGWNHLGKRISRIEETLLQKLYVNSRAFVYAFVDPIQKISDGRADEYSDGRAI